MNWKNSTNWKRSAINTMWCLIGCSIGDFFALWWFQTYRAETPMMIVMVCAIATGITTSIILETIILSRTQPLGIAFKTAVGMSLISMIAMELTMNLTDMALLGSLRFDIRTILPCMLAGFLVPWPYNYWRLEALGKSCCGGAKNAPKVP